MREIKVQAPRGEIVDRDGRVLVDNRTGLAVKITPGQAARGPARASRALRAARAAARHDARARSARRVRDAAPGAAVLGRDREART